MDLELALTSLAALLAFRSLPYAAYAVLSDGRRLALRCAVAATFGASLWAVPGAANLVGWSALGYGYYGLCACSVHWMAGGRKRYAASDSMTLLAVAFGLFLLLPSLLFGSVASTTFLILGWELTLKAHSYAMDAPAPKPSLKACFFFLFVDPSIVYPHRARQAERPERWRAAARAAGGAAALLAALLGGQAVARYFALPDGASVWVAVCLEAVRGIGRLLVAYASHSGLASLQIGLTRFCGYVAPERYHYPLAARSPAEFWSRWNIYVGQWARRYLFTPLSTHWARNRSRQQARLGSAAAALLTFLTLGVLHDAFWWVANRQLTFAATGFFASNALLVLAWHALVRPRDPRRAQAERRSTWLPAGQRAALLVALAGLVAASSP